MHDSRLTDKKVNYYAMCIAMCYMYIIHIVLPIEKGSQMATGNHI